jgi:hypothetical protein
MCIHRRGTTNVPSLVISLRLKGALLGRGVRPPHSGGLASLDFKEVCLLRGIFGGSGHSPGLSRPLHEVNLVRDSRCHIAGHHIV